MEIASDPRQRFLMSTLPGLLGDAWNYVRGNPGQAAVEVTRAVTPGGGLQDALAGGGAVSRGLLAGDAAQVAGGVSNMGLGLLGAIPVVGAAGTMAGRAARTADLRALARAEEMRAGGYSNEAIRNETGWFRRLFGGGGDIWRYEIPDTNARFTSMGEQMLSERNPRAVYNLFDVLDHPEYFAAYPDRARVRVTVDDPDMSRTARGAYSNDGPGYIGLRGGRGADDTRSTLLHELQHATQHGEGFPAGGSARTIWLGDDRPAALNEYRRLVERVATPMPFEDFARQVYGGRAGVDVEQAYREYVKSNTATVRDLQRFAGPMSRELQMDAARNAYLRLPGEVEARVVESRSLLKADSLASRDPNLDYLQEWRMPRGMEIP